VAPGGTVQQQERFPLSPKWPSSGWPANAVAWGYYPMHTHPSLPTGSYTATLALVDPATDTPQGRPVAVGRVAMRPSPCEFPLPPDAVRTSVLFGNDLRLLGYQLHHDENRLLLTLHWRAERRMEMAYKIFIHLFDPATQAPVAQDDAMPRRWAYPTQLWSPGEVVPDTIPISLEGVPAGAYSVAVGVYDAATTIRLPVVDGAGQHQPDNRLVLPGEAIHVERGP